MRIAIASSGLGHISRGIETWAVSLAAALQETTMKAHLFQGSGTSQSEWRYTLPCLQRFDPRAARLVRSFRRVGGWRYGLGSGYQVEQTTFALHLWRRVRRDYDLVHVQDPWLALLLDRLYRAGRSRPRVVLAHGTEEPVEVLKKYSYLQHLAPCYLDEWEPHRPDSQRAFAIPNFVDVEQYAPGDRQEARRRFGIAPDVLTVVCVAAVKRTHKRIDYLLREFSEFTRRSTAPCLLLVAGAREAETDEMMALGRELLGDRVRFLLNVPREDIPSLLRCADLFALASRHEMMPIAVLEALAAGLPVICNDTPVLRWMVGKAGIPGDLTREGGIVSSLQCLQIAEQRDRYATCARRQVESLFSRRVVLDQILGMYERVVT